MKRPVVLLSILLSGVLYPFTSSYCEILWLNDFQQFRFAVEKNGGSFLYEPTQYFSIRSDKETIQYNPVQGVTGPYDGIAVGDLTEYPAPIPGELRMLGLAKGPDGGVNPPGGLLVEGYLQVLPVGLGDNHAVDAEQKVVSFVSRRFQVDSPQDVTVKAVLDGVVDFDAFTSDPDHYFANYSLAGEVRLEQIVEAENLVGLVPGFPMDLSEMVQKNEITTTLVPTNAKGHEVEYQLIVILTMTSDFQNYDWQNSRVVGPIAGVYKLGSSDSPIRLRAVLSSTPTAMPWLPLLLLDDSNA